MPGGLLILDRGSVGNGIPNLFLRDPFQTRLVRKVTGDSNQTAQFTQARRQSTFFLGTAPRFVENGRHGAPIEMRNPTILMNLLGNKAPEFGLAFRRIRHGTLGEHFKTIAQDTRTQGGAYLFKILGIPCGDQNKITGQSFAANQGSTGA